MLSVNIPHLEPDHHRVPAATASAQVGGTQQDLAAQYLHATILTART
jgi:hypothetical protein